MKKVVISCAVCALMLSGYAQGQLALSTLIPSNWSRPKAGAVVGYYVAPTGVAVIGIIEKAGDASTDPSSLFESMKKNFSDSGRCPGLSQTRTESNAASGMLVAKSDQNGVVCMFRMARVGGQVNGLVSIEKTSDGWGAGNIADKIAAALFKPLGSGEAASSTRAADQISNLAPPTKRPVVQSSIEPVGVAGIWMGGQVRSYYDSVLGQTTGWQSIPLILTADGYFMSSVPDGLGFDAVSAQKRMREQASSAGKYTESANSLTLNFADGKVERIVKTRSGKDWQLTWNGVIMQPKRTFLNNTAFAGEYTTRRINQAGANSGVFVVGVDDFSFAPDGRFARGRQVSMSSAPVSIVDGKKSRSGYYEIRNSAIHLSYSDGKQEVLSVWQEVPGGPIWFDNEMFKPVSK